MPPPLDDRPADPPLPAPDTAGPAAPPVLPVPPVPSDGGRRPAHRPAPVARRRLRDLLRTPVQILATTAAGVGLPLLVLDAAWRLGTDLTRPAYLVVVAALVMTATTVWLEGLRALRPYRPPAAPAAPWPPAVLVVPAYLPNEAGTILDTVSHALAQDYPGPLTVVVAYNTPGPQPVEAQLRTLAAADPRLVVVEVAHSTTKAQNVNAALRAADGEVTGILDADHHPAPDALRRAWRALSHGADVVQGHCSVRNGTASWVARTVSVEFTCIYGVSHPGRAGLFGFGLFCGSNGYWRTEALRATRMQAQMLTEDIDASVRALLAGRRCVVDPGLLSHELAPLTVRAWWHQRLRWAQGWFQVSRRHLRTALRTRGLPGRARLGLLFLLGWRELCPWVTLAMVPVLAFGLHHHGPGDVVPLLLATTVYTLTVGPGQTLLAWRAAPPELRRPGWFLGYLLLSPLYVELRNVVARVAQLRELTGDRTWVITPRQGR